MLFFPFMFDFLFFTFVEIDFFTELFTECGRPSIKTKRPLKEAHL